MFPGTRQDSPNGAGRGCGVDEGLPAGTRLARAGRRAGEQCPGPCRRPSFLGGGVSRWCCSSRGFAAYALTQLLELALIALGISISLDELALQAFLAAQLGVAIGTRIGERWRERAEQVTGIALILLGAYLITDRLIQ
jgi:putative Mn2+ efflux pump MntP